MRTSYLVFSIPEEETLHIGTGVVPKGTIHTTGGFGSGQIGFFGVSSGSVSSGTIIQQHPIQQQFMQQPFFVNDLVKESGIGMIRLGNLTRVILRQPVTLGYNGIVSGDTLYDPNSGDVFFRGEVVFDGLDWVIPFLINEDGYKIFPNCSIAAHGMVGRVVRELVLCEDDLVSVKLMFKARKEQVMSLM